MNIDQLRYLADLAKTHSINQTAENFYITHQGVGKALKNLERELQTELINRSAKGVTLTTSGEYLNNKAQTIIATYNEILEYYNRPSNNTQLTGTLHIHCLTRLLENYLGSFITFFNTTYPNIALNITTGASYEILENFSISGAAIDIGLISLVDFKTGKLNSDFLQKQHLTFTPFHQEKIYLCAHKKYFKGKVLDCIAQFDFHNHTLISYRYLPLHNPLLSKFKGFIEIDSIEAQYNMVKSCLGVALITEKEFKNYYQQKKDCLLLQPCSQAYLLFGILLPENPTPIASLFADELINHFQNN